MKNNAIEVRQTSYPDWTVVEFRKREKYRVVADWCHENVKREQYMLIEPTYIIVDPLVANLIKLKFDV